MSGRTTIGAFSKQLVGPSVDAGRVVAALAGPARVVRWLCAIGFACMLLIASAAATGATTSPLRFNRLDALGLDEQSVVAMLQDRQGFVWIGTANAGLYRFDGYRMVHYVNAPDKRRSLPGDAVLALHEDGAGRIWAGTDGGLARFEPRSDDFTLFAPPAGPNNHRVVKAIVPDGADGMWLATWGGLQHVDPVRGRFRQFVHDPANPASLSSNDVNAITLDAHGGVWAATWAGGLDYLAPGASAVIHHRLDAPRAPDPGMNRVRALRTDPGGTLWIGTDRGVVTWDPARAWQSRRPLALAPTRVNAFYPDQGGVMWIATLTGLVRWKGSDGSMTTFTHRAADAHSLPSDHIRTVMRDRGGMLWVAVQTDGIRLANLNSEGFVRYLPHDAQGAGEPVSNAMLSMAQAPGGRLWLGGRRGLSLFAPATGAVSAIARGALGESAIHALYQSPGGPLWLGTSSGLWRMAPGKAPLPVAQVTQPGTNAINAIAPGRGGALWLGTGDSLIRYDSASGAQRTYRHDPGDTASRAVDGSSCLLEDSRGRLWVGSEYHGGGLDMLDPRSGKFVHFRHDPARADSLLDDRVRTLYEDRDGRILVGSAGGLNVVESAADGTPRLRSLTGATGRWTPAIAAILDDAAGRIWVSTATGLSVLDPRSGALSHFHVGDGLTGNFRGGVALRGGDGELYFGGAKGITALRPGAVRAASTPPQVAIVGIHVLNGAPQPGQFDAGVALDAAGSTPLSLDVAAGERGFAVEFAALHYNDPGKNRYAYRLAGFERDWVRTDAAHRRATYTNLDPGRYRFEVLAANDQGVWSARAAAMVVTIAPPFWKTWWFRLLAAALLGGLLLAALRLRVTLLTRRRNELEKLVIERTAEVLLQTEIIEIEKAEVERQKTRVEQAHRNILFLSEVGRQLSATLDPEAVMLTVYEQVRSLMDASVFGIGICQTQPGPIALAFWIERQRRMPPQETMSDPDRLAAWCVERQAEVVINDIDRELATYLAPGAPCRQGQAHGERPRSLLFVPMLINGRVFGVLTVQSFSKNAYQSVHVNLLKALASHVVVAMDNANAYQQLSQALDALTRTQQQLVLQEKMASIGTLTAGIAHEINNPVNFAHAGAQVLEVTLERFRRFLLELAGEESGEAVLASLNQRIDELVGQLATIVDGTSRIRTLVADLRAFSRQQDSHKVPVAVGATLLCTVNLVRTYFSDETDIDCELEIDPVIECRPARLNQVFMNLIVNACHAIRSKRAQHPGSAPGLLRISSRIERELLCIDFEDNGCGIRSDLVGRIFDPFFTTKGVGDGTGLGLSISFGIMEEHGGAILVRSSEGEGSCFTVQLPLIAQGQSCAA
ncbi:two-component regulator propeller domain-containing protein [Massilia pseudoviolaceinigra]|uniref:two-component regulator propeller domain-containing protein n=1 Tax=Massilia pseudoviolaceinigra TaxID=3057165 RepID=UPI0027964182|nr:two-component regulator propeller domain-containing protein [Massilia sp. CCM 9206]MDQ1919258.1 two-component regulator propeller domain-containing protein [Massilia sp. CCM 9206]